MTRITQLAGCEIGEKNTCSQYITTFYTNYTVMFSVEARAATVSSSLTHILGCFFFFFNCVQLHDIIYSPVFGLSILHIPGRAGPRHLETALIV